jgi:Flp pilus assembly protein TadG
MSTGLRHARKGQRRGAAAVEFAISASILFGFIFGAMEFSRVNMIRHSVDNAAYEAARRAIVPGATAADAEAAARDILSVIWARGVDVDVDPEVIQDTTTEVIVTVTVPAAGNGFIAPHFFRGKAFVGECRLAREEQWPTAT